MRTAHINIRTEPETKYEAESILKRLGMTTSEAINLFLRRIIMSKGIPFSVRLPNEETVAAMKEIENGHHLDTSGDTEEMFEKSGIIID